MNKNYYNILDLDETASLDDVKAAYRTLAKTCHPDQNPDDPTAEEHFKQINEAHEYLIQQLSSTFNKQGEPKKAAENNDSGFSDVWNDMFGSFNDSIQRRP